MGKVDIECGASFQVSGLAKMLPRRTSSMFTFVYGHCENLDSKMRFIGHRLILGLALIAIVVLSLPLATSGALSMQSVKTSSSSDGPAELPRVYVTSSLAGTPARGNARLVKTSDE